MSISNFPCGKRHIRDPRRVIAHIPPQAPPREAAERHVIATPDNRAEEGERPTPTRPVCPPPAVGEPDSEGAAQGAPSGP
ncbi:hypothetical protein GCM10020367_28070 [Streptomyces sannanensis]|uniref:Uncharacterized protein n=1 Tax=Streptomyces sannanensis TaxID=285536 RepID=A0ABP6SC87_9ACTN